MAGRRGRPKEITKEMINAFAEQESDDDWLFGVLRSLPLEAATSLPSEWAEQNRFMTSTATPFPGRWSWRRSPWFREVVDHLSPHSPIQRVAVMKSTQIAYTAAVIENAVGFTIAAQPAPVLYVTGNEDLVESTKKTRLEPMIDSSGLRPKIRADVVKKGIKRTGDSKNLTEFQGGFMRMCGPNTESSFQGISFKVELLDEIDLYPPKVGRSGETVKVIEARTDAFGHRKKILYGSRPTVAFGIAEQEAREDEDAATKKDTTEVGSRILDLFNAGDQRKYMVPCPHCGEKQELVFFKGTTHEGITYGVSFDSEACKEGDFSSIRYLCRGCGEGIEEYHKSEMVQPEAGAEWVATAKAKEPHFVSYQISSLYSLTVSWQEIVVEFMGAKGDPDKLQLFYNRMLGLPFENRTGGVEVAKLADKTGAYPVNTVPDGVLFLTAAVDVQRGKNARLEVEVRGWGREHRNKGIAYRIIKGNTEDENDPCYKELADMLDEVWTDDRGARYQIERMLIDSGDGTVTSTIYAVCRKYGQGDSALMLPLKGQAVTSSTRVYQKVAELPNERFPLIEVYGDKYKNKLSLWLKQDWRPGEAEPGGWTQFPSGEGYGREYFRQLGNDERVLIRKGSHTIVQWKSRGRIETWDVLCYNAACEDFVIEDYSLTVLGLEKGSAPAVWDWFEAERGLTQEQN